MPTLTVVLSSLQAAEALTAAEEEKAVVQERCKEGG